MVATGPSPVGAVAHPDINASPTHTATAKIIPENMKLTLLLFIFSPPFLFSFSVYLN